MRHSVTPPAPAVVGFAPAGSRAGHRRTKLCPAERDRRRSRPPGAHARRERGVPFAPVGQFGLVPKRQRWRAPSPLAASSRSPGCHSVQPFPARASRCRAAGASVLRSGGRGGIVSDALTVVDRGAPGPSCSNLAVGMDRPRWWSPVWTGRADGQRSCGRGSRRYRLHALRPRRASLLRAYRNVHHGMQPSARSARRG